MDEVIRQIERLATGHPELRSDLNFGPLSEGDVRRVEEVLGVNLPWSFRAYLRGFSGGMMMGYEIYGIPTPASRIPPWPAASVSDDAGAFAVMSIVDINRRMRKHYPPSHIYFCNDGGDFSFFLCADRISADGECPVIMYGPGADGIEVAKTFLGFLQKLSRRTFFRSNHSLPTDC